MEEVKRLTPTTDTLRRLYTVSGNQCSFPGCIKPMFNNEGNFVGQVCHICAAMPGGERFDPQMSNEQRRRFDNLMLMCYDHHIETNKEEYTPQRLRQFKNEHEKRFTNLDCMIGLMQDSIVDVTASFKSSSIDNLQALNSDTNGKEYSQSFDSTDIAAFNRMIKIFEKLSPQARKTFAISLSRSKHEKSFLGHDSEKIYFDPLEIERVTGKKLKPIFDELQVNEVIYLDEISIGGEQIINGYVIPFKGSEINFWDSINNYCMERGLDVVEIVTDMKFTVFDQ